jgi:hypothetical protein
MKHLAYAPALMVAVPTFAVAATTPDRGAIDRKADEILGHLKAGDAAAVVETSIGVSPLMSGKDAEKQSLISQIQTTFQIYGPVSSVDLAKEVGYGSLVVKRFYVAQHEKALTRWQITFIKLPTGWTVVHIAFDDQVPGWAD